MRQTQSDLRYARFGAFEADLQTQELRRNGRKAKLSGQPFQILAILLEHPGELVTREELQNRVWPDTIVDVERNLNSAINRMREVLGDATGRPRFIEALPRRGYRFIADVRTVPQEDRHSLEQQQDRLEDTAFEIVPELREDSPVHHMRGNATFVWLVLVAIVAIAIAAGWYLFRPLPTPRITAHWQITHSGRPKQLIGTDGSRLFFNHDLGTVAQVSVSGGESAQIPIPLDHVTALLDVSRDGSNLLVLTHQDGYHPDGQLWTVHIFGGSIHRLPDGWDGAFSPDGNLVTYANFSSGAIWIVHSDGTGARSVASIGRPALGRSIAWSPDGNRIRAFTWDGRLWETSADGLDAHELQVRWPGSAFRCCGHWTLDGKLFLFLNGTSAGYFPQPKIWAMDERHRLFRHSSPEPIQLTSGPIEWGSPIPSPEGKTLYADAGTSRGELSRFDAKSGQFQPFLGGMSAQGLSFSPDVKSIAYVSLPEGILWKADRDGSNPIQLSEPGMDVWAPRWSPDSAQIIFYDRVGNGMNSGHMYVVSTSGGTPRRVIPEGKFPEMDPGWSSGWTEDRFRVTERAQRRTRSLGWLGAASA